MQYFCVRARERAYMSEGWKDAIECGTGRKQPSKGLNDVTPIPGVFVKTKMPSTISRPRLRCAWKYERSCAARFSTI
jgi:hypothetical protein